MTTSSGNDHSARQQSAQKLVKGTRAIPTLPAAAVRAGQIANDPSTTADELASTLAGDPVLCAQLLKVSNSAFFGLRAEVSNIKHATVVLGRRTIRSLAMAASIQAVFPKQCAHPSFPPQILWSHSIRTAGACSELSKVLGIGTPEDAFVAGLIHDLGLLVEIQHTEEFAHVLRNAGAGGDASGAGFLVCEREIFGADHQDVGAALFKTWGFPEVLVQAAGCHHQPEIVEGPSRTLAALVNAAESVGADGEHCLAQATHDGAVDSNVLEFLGVDAEELSSHAARLLQAAANAESAFDSGDAAAA